MPSRRTDTSPRRASARLFSSRLLLAGSAVVVAIAALILLLVSRPGDALQDSATGAPLLNMTLDPAIVDNMTRLPQATPLAGTAAAAWHNLQAMVDACPDYSPERRAQMTQHIQWVLEPASIPANLIPALGGDPTARLAFGLAGFTSIEWRLAGRPTDSCLVEIGLWLDEQLEALGEAPLDLYPANG